MRGTVSEPDYYQLLGVSPDCTIDVIHARYREIVRQLSSNPGSARHLPSLPLVNEAYRTLGDSSSRAAYDRPRLEAEAEAAAALMPAPAAPKAVAPRSGCQFCNAVVPDSVIVGPDTTCDSCGAPLCSAQYHASHADSRRALDRLPFSMRIVFLRADGLAHRAISDDVSLGGVRVLTRVGLTVGERVMLDCDFCAAVATVRHVQTADAASGLMRCGLQFVTLRLKHQRGGLISTVA